MDVAVILCRLTLTTLRQRRQLRYRRKAPLITVFICKQTANNGLVKAGPGHVDAEDSKLEFTIYVAQLTELCSNARRQKRRVFVVDA